MKKFNLGKILELIGMIGLGCVAFGILSWAFIFLWQIIKSIF